MLGTIGTDFATGIERFTFGIASLSEGIKPVQMMIGLFAGGELLRQSTKLKEKREMVNKGLENALTNVKNENARQKLERNMNRWMEKYQERLEKMEEVEVEEVDEETGEM